MGSARAKTHLLEILRRVFPRMRSLPRHQGFRAAPSNAYLSIHHLFDCMHIVENGAARIEPQVRLAPCLARHPTSPSDPMPIV